MGLAWNVLRWPRDARRARSVRLIGTVPTFGWRYDVGGKSLGFQWSTGLRHGYVLLSWGGR